MGQVGLLCRGILYEDARSSKLNRCVEMGVKQGWGLWHY